MEPQKQDENAQDELRGEEKLDSSMLSFKTLVWHGGSVYDAWFSCASNQVISLKINVVVKLSSNSIERLVLLLANMGFGGLRMMKIWIVDVGGTGSFNFAILILSTGNALRSNFSSFLWCIRKLDCLSH